MPFKRLRRVSKPRTKRGRAEDANCSSFWQGCCCSGRIEEASPQSKGCSTDSYSSFLNVSRDHAEAARMGSVRRRRMHVDTPQKRAERAQMLVLMGDVSAGRHALDGASLAQGTQETLQQFRRRPQVPKDDVSRELTHSENTFTMDHNLFTKNLKCARRGAANGPSGMTAEHLKSLLHNFRETELFCQVGEHFARGKIPRGVLEIVRMGRMTAWQKANGGVRGIVAGDMVRRLVRRTIAQQICGLVGRATSPFQYALSTRCRHGVHRTRHSGNH